VSFVAAEGPVTAHCFCPVGNYMCSHIVAVLLFSQKMMSRTDFPSVWNRQNLGSHDGKRKIEELWLPVERPTKSLKSAVDEQSLAKLNPFLDRREHFGLHWLLSKLPQAS
jgi:uncharacterized Zn finger protein